MNVVERSVDIRPLADIPNDNFTRLSSLELMCRGWIQSLS